MLLVGCEFSIWGNIWKYFIDALSMVNNRFNTFIYVWKLWSLDINIEPNKYLATGDSSYVKDKLVTWKNLFRDLPHSNIVYWTHITCYSVIEETIHYIHQHKKHWKFIDPEIWNMALACKENWKDFSYLHIISDNVIIPYKENLSNERKSQIVEKRKKLFIQIWEIIQKYI
jgi:hypothetical protein